MAEKVNVEIGGKSKYEVAKQMAEFIFDLEGNASMRGVTRQQYLRAVSECMNVLEGGWPF